jgi:hypothetical protein
MDLRQYAVVLCCLHAQERYAGSCLCCVREDGRRKTTAGPSPWLAEYNADA